MPRRLAVCLVLAFAASLARAEDDPAKPAEKESGLGFHCFVTLTNGRTKTGVVVAPGTWEKKNAQGVWEPCSKEDKGAAVRLAHVAGSPGFVVLDAVRIASAENKGPVVQADLDRRAKELAETEKRVKEERDRLRLKRKAQAEVEAAEEAKAAEAAAIAKKAAAEAEKIKAEDAILAKFPPAEWNAERIEKIKKSRLLLDIQPTDLEREFMESYDAWARALESRKAREAAELAAKAKK
jgi:hypothetical protein